MFPVHENDSGSFQELAHDHDVKFGQLSILTIKPGFTRGGHYHKRKEEWFCCIHGKCTMKMEHLKTGNARTIDLEDNKREFIKIEPWENHFITNTGDEDCEVLIIISESYNDDDPDTFRPEE